MSSANDSGNSGIENWLRVRGFDLFAVMDPTGWPEPLKESFQTLEIDLPVGVRIAMLGSAGPTLWKIVRRDHWHDSHPIDRYTISTVEQLKNLYWRGQKIGWLHPSPYPIPIQRLC